VVGIERGSEQIRTLTAATTIESDDRLIVAGCQKAVDKLHAALIHACLVDGTS
jgi:Trk K+ transport system NAD-binding subunit